MPPLCFIHEGDARPSLNCHASEIEDGRVMEGSSFWLETSSSTLRGGNKFPQNASAVLATCLVRHDLAEDAI